MILCALLVAAGLFKTDAELVPPIAPGVITVEALMRLPRVGPRERAELAVLADALLDDTEEYGHRQLIDLTVMSGDTVRCDLYPDALRVRFGVLATEAASVVPILENIVHRAELQDDALNAAADARAFRRRDYWTSALEPEVFHFRAALIPDLRTLYRVVGRPENLVVTFAAEPSIGMDLLAHWHAAVDAWPVVRNEAFPPDASSPQAITRRRGKLTTILLRGRPILPNAPTFVQSLLAVFALGGGKDSAVWRALREGLGWSYRQEALLRNAPSGLEPAIEVVTLGTNSDMDRAQAVRPALEAAVAAWTEADKAHALAAADALFNRGLGLDPLYFKSTRPASDDPLFMATYWRFKTGETWRPATLLAAMQNVDLDKLRAAAKSILDSANVEVIRGSG